MNHELPELHDFFGAYFHQDWLIEYDTPDEIIADFLQTSDPEIILSVCKELQFLLSQNKDELALRDYLLRKLSCYYCYWNEWASGQEWLNYVLAVLQNGKN
ncbi:contact-dependent growth inhibition system immunity protein [Pseudomonas sp. NPDC088414]|uniref:contact-dependent growth inhibition system immunity protein n=1 Tax=Pseudomonas sp. NPDC088414 TaxID=3364454 RepID=UPI00380E416F